MIFVLSLSLQNLGGMDCPDLEFIYSDTDTHPNEIAELYSYTEQNEFAQNIRVSFFKLFFVLFFTIFVI